MIKAWSIGAVSCALALTACSQSEVEPQPIHVGATMSQSGAFATQGIPAMNGYRLCEQHINEAGGVLGRPLHFTIYDDESDTDKVQALYEQLITEDEVDVILGPYGSTLTEALASVTEQHRMVQISPLAATTSIWEQGREYLFMVLPPAELFLAGLIDMADTAGLQRVAVLHEDALFPQAAANGAAELATERGMQVPIAQAYPSGEADFNALARELAQQEIEVLAMAASTLSDFAAMTEALKAEDVNLAMFGTSGAVQEFYDSVGTDGEYVYGLSAWEPSAPNPGAAEFTHAYQQRFERAPSFHAAGGYGSCQLLVAAIEQAQSLQQDAIRDALLNLEMSTVFGDFAVDERGYQVANQGLFIQWQDGEKVVVWPEDVATHAPRLPTPAWNDR